jgi:hypothetical protein
MTMKSATVKTKSAAKTKSKEPSNIAKALKHLIDARDRMMDAGRPDLAAKVDVFISDVGFVVIQRRESVPGLEPFLDGSKGLGR